MSMPIHAGADDFSFHDIQGGKQSRGAMPFVVMGHGAAPSLFEGQAGLAPIQGLNAGFFIDAQYQGMFRRVEIESDYIPKLFSKMRILGKFEVRTRWGLI